MDETPARSKYSLFGKKPKALPQISETQDEMIGNIITLADLTARDIMTHRVDIVAAGANALVADVARLAVAEGVSRIPVYREDIDDIIGVLLAKDFLPLVGENVDGITVEKYIHDVIFVSESSKCISLFKQLTASHAQLAIVVDEFGGTSGLVTMEDILESIVGEMEDEFDEPESETIRQEGGVFYIDGDAEIDEVSERLGVALPESEDYDTLGGLLIDALGYIPSDGEQPSVEVEGVPLVFCVEQVEDRRIERVTAREAER